jgi:alpha-galactosidase
MPLKIAMIGAGSIGFTRRLMADILTVPELADTHFAFHDINAHNLDMVKQLAERDIKGNDLPATISTTVDRRTAVADADYVISTVRIGGLGAFESTSAWATPSARAGSCTASAVSPLPWISARIFARSPNPMFFS